MSKYTRKKKEEVKQKEEVGLECLKEFLPIMDKEQESLGNHIIKVLDIQNFYEMVDPYKKLINRFDSVENFLETPFSIEGQIYAFQFYNKSNPEECLDKLENNAEAIKVVQSKMESIGNKMLEINPDDKNIKDYRKALKYRLEFMNNSLDYFYLYGFHMGLKWCFGLCDDFELLNLKTK